MQSSEKEAVFGSICFYDTTSDHVRFLIPPVITEDTDKLKLQQTIDSYNELITLSSPALRKSDYRLRYAVFDVRLQEESHLPTRTLFVFNTEIGNVGLWNFLLAAQDDVNVSATVEDLQMRCRDVVGIIKRQNFLQEKDSTYKSEIMYERIQKAWIIALLHFLKETEEYSEKADELRFRDLRPIGVIEIPLSVRAREEIQKTMESTTKEEDEVDHKKDSDLAAVFATEEMKDLKTLLLDHLGLFSKLCLGFLMGVFVAASKFYKIQLRPKEALMERVGTPDDFILLLTSKDDDRWCGSVSCAPPEERYGIAVTRRRQLISIMNRYMSTRRRTRINQAIQELFEDFFKRKTLEASPAYVQLLLRTDLATYQEAATPEELEAARQEVLEMQELENLRKFFFEEHVLQYILDFIGISASKISIEIAKKKGIIDEETESKYLDIFVKKREESHKELFGDKEHYIEVLLERLDESIEHGFRKDILERIEGFEEIRAYCNKMTKDQLLEFFAQ